MSADMPMTHQRWKMRGLDRRTFVNEEGNVLGVDRETQTPYLLTHTVEELKATI